jgi:hypothetical protein
VSRPSAQHFTAVALKIHRGDVVPFLGAGAGVSARPLDSPWRPGQEMPSGTDLAKYLAAQQLLADGHEDDLIRVAQYVATMSGYRELYTTLHQLFDVDFLPTPLHTFLAGLPTLLSGKRYAERDPGFTRYQLIVTTNYDDTLERAFRAADEPYELVTYKAEGEHRGRFVHWVTDTDPVVIDDPMEYVEPLPLTERTVILKIHGMVVRDQARAEWESFVITEDHYIDYLVRADISTTMPSPLVAQLRNASLLFLGYGLRDWNLRVILQSIWMERDLSVPSWAVQVAPDGVDEMFWSKRDIAIVDEQLSTYVEALDARLREVLARVAA